jgi:hypothetical protein
MSSNRDLADYSAPPIDVASAGVMSLVGAYVIRVTGTADITAFGTMSRGATRMTRFVGTPRLIHDPVNLILPTSANIQSRAGDTAEWESHGTGWRCTSYTRADGTSLAVDAATAATLTRADRIRRMFIARTSI